MTCQLCTNDRSIIAKAKRLGIMGGTFDPIHVAHLAIAEAARVAFALDVILFIPAANPPHKLTKRVTAAEQRLNMVQLAVNSNPYFYISTQELEREGPSYSLLTLQELHANFGDDKEYYFITGSDSINDLPTWYKVQDLLAQCHFIGTTRPGAPIDMTELQTKLGAATDHIHQLAVPELAISSTLIREMVAAGKSIRYLVPDAVRTYIEKEGLYR